MEILTFTGKLEEEFTLKFYICCCNIWVSESFIVFLEEFSTLTTDTKCTKLDLSSYVS